MPDNTQQNNQETVSAEAFRELESKYNAVVEKGYTDELAPLAEKLESNPELMKAIIEGKIDDKTIQQVMEGSKTAQQAVTESKTVEAKQPDSKVIDPEAILKRIDEVESKVENRFSVINETQRLIDDQSLTEADIDELSEWYKDHPERESVPVTEAWEGILGRRTIQERVKQADEARQEAERRKAASAQGGEGQATTSSKQYNPFGPHRAIGGL